MTDQEHAMTEAKEECWSADEENFPYSTLHDLLDCNDQLEAGDTVYVGTPERPDPTDFIGADDVIEEMATRAYDIGGEWAEDYPDVSKEAKAELEELLAAWVRKHCPVTFYRVVDVREYEITAEDLAERTSDSGAER